MQIDICDNQTECAIDCDKLEGVIRNILIPLECLEKEVSILLVDDKRMRELNKQYRDLDQTTDVLSFPQNDGEEEGLSPHLLGDVVISTATARRQSTEHGLSLQLPAGSLQNMDCPWKKSWCFCSSTASFTFLDMITSDLKKKLAL